jgi:hypothetical protein
MTEAAETGIVRYSPRRVPITADELAAWFVENDSSMPVAHGSCPRCAHETESTITTTIVRSSDNAHDQSPGPMIRLFLCNCHEAHPGRPISTPGGCGASWLTVIEQLAGTWQLSPVELEAATELAASDVAATRATAEKWVQGITTLIGLFGLAGAVITRNAASQLQPWAKATLALLLVIAVSAAAVAIYSSYRAAYGWLPKPTEVADEEGLIIWAKQRQQAQLQAVVSGGTNLRVAVLTAAVAIAALMIALGIVWLSPATAAQQSLVRVKYYDNGNAGQPATACGPLLPSNKAGIILVQVANGGATHAIEIKGEWIRAVKPARVCP